MAKKDYLGVEPAFVGDNKPYTGLTGKIPKLPPQPNPIPTAQNPLVYYVISQIGNTAVGGAWYTLEADDNKTWHIHHIHIRVNNSLAAGTYGVSITDTALGGIDGTFYLQYQLVGDSKQIDLDFHQAIIFKKRIRVWIGLGAGNDPYTISMFGYVQNK